MELTFFLAKVIGLYMSIVGLIILLRHNSMKKTIDAFFSNYAMSYLVGVLVTIMGILLVVSHNIWEMSAAGLITVINWLVLLKGIFYLSAPHGALMKIKKCFSNDKHWLILAGLFSLALGLYLMKVGFGLGL